MSIPHRTLTKHTPNPPALPPGGEFSLSSREFAHSRFDQIPAGSATHVIHAQVIVYEPGAMGSMGVQAAGLEGAAWGSKLLG